MRKGWRFGAMIVLLLLLAACNHSDFPDHVKSSKGYYYKYLALGDHERPVLEDGYISLSLHYQTTSGDTLFRVVAEDFVMETGLDSSGGFFPALLKEPLLSMVEGDSVSFVLDIARAENAVFPDTCDVIQAIVAIHKAKTPAEYRAEQRHIAWLNDQELKEQQRLATYLAKAGIGKRHYLEGIYFLEQKRGSGRKVVSGDGIYVHYKGFFLDGEEFDSTYEMGVPFDFVLGDPDQVIPGLSLGIYQMHVGGKAKFIIPSQLGFGDKGSSTGIVPPFTTLIYEVELIKVL